MTEEEECYRYSVKISVKNLSVLEELMATINEPDSGLLLIDLKEREEYINRYLSARAEAED